LPLLKGWIPKSIPIQLILFDVALLVRGFTTKPIWLY